VLNFSARHFDQGMGERPVAIEKLLNRLPRLGHEAGSVLQPMKFCCGRQSTINDLQRLHPRQDLWN